VTPTPVRVLREGKDVDLLIAEIPSTLRLELEPRADATAAQRAARRAWLGQPAAP
jgi:hypothetical protein